MSHVKVRDGTVRHEVVKEGWGDDRSLPAPDGKAMGVFGRDNSPSCLGGMQRAIQPGRIGDGSQPKMRWLNPTPGSKWRPTDIKDHYSPSPGEHAR